MSNIGTKFQVQSVWRISWWYSLIVTFEIMIEISFLAFIQNNLQIRSKQVICQKKKDYIFVQFYGIHGSSRFTPKRKT